MALGDQDMAADDHQGENGGIEVAAGPPSDFRTALGDHTMSDVGDRELETVLKAYDEYHEDHEVVISQAAAAVATYDARFRQGIASVTRPYFEKEVALQLESHGHTPLVEEGSVSPPDPRLAGASKITLTLLPRARAQQNLRHRLELNDAAHLILRCDTLKGAIELFHEPDPGFKGEDVAFRSTRQIEEVTRDNLRERVILMIREELAPEARVRLLRSVDVIGNGQEEGNDRRHSQTDGTII
jgi:hypothetical protein